MDEQVQPTGTAEPTPGSEGLRPDRRTVILAGSAATAGALAWTVPSIRSVAAAQAATAAPLAPFPGMAAWYDAGVGVTLSAGQVVVWGDQSGNANDATQTGDPMQQPTFVASAINGLPALSFDGSEDVLVIPFAIDPDTAPDLTVFAVFQSNTDGFELRKLYSNDFGFDRAAGLDTRAGTNYAYFSFAGPGAEVSDYFNLVAGTPYLTVDQWTTTSFTGTVNGTNEVSAAPVAVDGGAPFTYLGALNELGGEPWDGLIAEVIIYIGALAPADVLQTQTYLLDKYGL